MVGVCFLMQTSFLFVFLSLFTDWNDNGVAERSRADLNASLIPMVFVTQVLHARHMSLCLAITFMPLASNSLES